MSGGAKRYAARDESGRKGEVNGAPWRAGYGQAPCF